MNDTQASFGRGALSATFLAGPVAVSIAALAGHVTGQSGWRDIAGFAVILLVSIPFGAILAVLPNAIGAAILSRSGRTYRVARSWAAWGAAGTTMGALIGVACRSGGWFTAWFAANGLVCALICRRGAAWHD